MLALKLLVFLLSAFSSAAKNSEDLNFPPGFKFGVATAAYQVEGAWNVSDKSESIWDRFTHTHPENIKGRSTGDIACDSYHNWKRDVEMVAELGAHFYRFSISWTRLMPQGLAIHVSEDGKKYYNNLIDGLLEKGIEPVVTIYHWDLPQRLQEYGGWTNPLISDWFADYARVVFTIYGDRVKTWITLNEPIIFCDLAFNMGSMAPGVLDPDFASYLCNKHAVLAHAKAYRIYDKEFRAMYHGRLSLASQLLWIDPVTKENEELAELARLNMVRSSHPIFSKEGGWPPAIEKIIAENSRKKGYSRSSLPPFSQSETELVKGTFDFYAVNYYTGRLIRKARPGDKFGPWPLEDCKDLDAIVELHPTWNRTAAYWFYVHPNGLRRKLVWLKKQYGDLNFIITENGYPSSGGLNDADRIKYYRNNLEQILLAIKDGVNVTGYTAWSLMDNFEWMDGYETKFGLYEVAGESPLRTRTPRASARYYASVVASHSLDVPDIEFQEEVVLVESNSTSSFVTHNERLYFVGIVALVVALAVAIAAYVWRGRRLRHTEDSTAQRPTYIPVKIGDD